MSYGLQGGPTLNPGFVGAVGYPINTAAQEVPPCDPMLQRLLHRLYSIREALGAAAGRELQLADRLLGSEPATLGKGVGPKEATDPPVIHRLEQVVDDLAQLSETIHHHLNRLERL